MRKVPKSPTGRGKQVPIAFLSLLVLIILTMPGCQLSTLPNTTQEPMPNQEPPPIIFAPGQEDNSQETQTYPKPQVYIPARIPPSPSTQEVEQEQSVNLPQVIALTSSVVDPLDLHNKVTTVIEVTLSFTPENSPGYYKVTLLSSRDDFGDKVIDWYGGTNITKVYWTLTTGTETFNDLLKGVSYKEILETRIEYQEFYSKTASIISDPIPLEKDIARSISDVRENKKLTPLLWSQRNFDFATEEVEKVGKLGKLSVSDDHPRDYLILGHESRETTEPQELLDYWVRQEQSRGILYDPRIKEIGVKTDTYSNNKYYTIVVLSY
ncbi:MAG: hypothetical protein Q8Q07_04085 [Dehalococcoidales bacterium]|nr:hypothetical protein [Dehalococcoidales bacterium]